MMRETPLMPETWTALALVPGAAPAEDLAEALEALNPVGVGCFEIDEKNGVWEVGGYFLQKPDIAALALLSVAYGAADFAVSRVEDRDWVAQVRRELTPVEAGRFYVHSAHDAHRVPPSAIGLRIEAAMAFGTGHHETTQGCLLAIDALARRGAHPRNVLDVGCGTGVLAMGAASVWRVPAYATDIDAVATRTAQENIAINQLRPWVQAATATGLKAPEVRRRGPYDLVTANILAGPLKRLAPDMVAATRPGGSIVLSGILNRQAIGVEKVYAGWGAPTAQRLRLGEWTTLTLRRI